MHPETLENFILFCLRALSEGDLDASIGQLAMDAELDADVVSAIRARTFADAGLLTRDQGVVVTSDDGDFQITIASR